jgi:hypothetical protein
MTQISFGTGRLFWRMLPMITAAFLSFSSPAQAQEKPTPPEAAPRKGPTHDVTDEASLRLRAERAAKLQSSVARKARPPTDPPPSTQSSLMSSSILITDGENYTIVPIGSVLILPGAHRSKIVNRAQGDLLLWPDFLKRNSAWLAAREVSLKMSQGDSRAGEAVMRELAGETRLVVAVHKNCPISILEPIQAPRSDSRNQASRP